MNNTLKFIKENLQNAYAVNVKYGINYLAVLAQSALETGWGKHVKDFNYFGIKGKGQIIKTTELLDSPNYSSRFPHVYSIEKVSENSWLYVVDDYFRGYKSPYESFMDYGKFIHENSNYSEALKVKSDYKLYLKEVYAAGYATGANYDNICISIAEMIEGLIEENNLEVIIKP